MLVCNVEKLKMLLVSVVENKSFCWLVLLKIIAVVLLNGVVDRNKCCWLVMLEKEGENLLVGLVEKLVVVTGCCC